MDLLGSLEMTIKSADLTRDTDILTKMDPYCTFEFTHKTKGVLQTHKTKVHEAAGKKPIWNEKFTLPVDLPPAEVGNAAF